jgi:hypothetical protein
MLAELWILSLFNKSDTVDCFNEEHEKIIHLCGDWQEKKLDIFKQLTSLTRIHDFRKNGDLGLELALYLKEVITNGET